MPMPNSILMGKANQLRKRHSKFIWVARSLSILRELAETSRLLIKTGRWSNAAVFPDQIPVIAADIAAWLQKNGVKLLGLDLPSVDEIDSKSLQNHHALSRAGIAIVESLDLSRVGSGIYNLAALPLRIAGGDCAPLRADLWRD
jgi:arylformamidase